MTREELINHPGLSFSSLKLLRSNIQEFYQYKILGQEIERNETDAMRLGSLIDCFLLEPEVYGQKYMHVSEVIAMPRGSNQTLFCDLVAVGNDLADAYRMAYVTKNKSENRILAEAQDLYSSLRDYIELEKKRQGRQLVDPKTQETLTAILTKINSNPTIARFFPVNDRAQYQVPVAGELTIDDRDVEMKGLIDIVFPEEDFTRIIDLKSTSRSMDQSIWQIISRSYHEQLWIYSQLWQKEHPDVEVRTSIIFVQTVSPWNVWHVELGFDIELDARQKFEEDVRRYWYHLDNDQWEWPAGFESGVFKLNSVENPWGGVNNLVNPGSESSENEESLENLILENFKDL